MPTKGRFTLLELLVVLVIIAPAGRLRRSQITFPESHRKSMGRRPNTTRWRSALDQSGCSSNATVIKRIGATSHPDAGKTSSL